jgi:RNA polymerase sigma-70 factor (sigma-E family)
MTAGKHTGTAREDEFLAGVYEQVIGAQAERYAAAYDASAGLERFTDWLQDHTAAELDLEADRALVELYSLHYRALVRLAAMLVRDTATAEEVVRDAMVSMRRAWPRLRDAEKALAYLRQHVVNRSRTVLRHRIAVEHTLQQPLPEIPSAEHAARVQLERSEVVAALRALPARQREAILLRYYADLTEAEIAATMGISRGAVKAHTTRGMAMLRAVVEQATAQSAHPQDLGHRPADP